MKITKTLKKLVRRTAKPSPMLPGVELLNRIEHFKYMTKFEKQSIRPSQDEPNMQRLSITWIIPDFMPGAGGHMTIFRIARYLEEFGHDVRFLIQNPRVHASGEAARESINVHFQPFKGEVILLNSPLPELQGDALIATDRFTCYPVEAMTGFHRKFYFVQDYETQFYPVGTEALLTDATYHFDFDCLCAGEWLKQIMSTKFDRWATSWPLAVDHEVYQCAQPEARKENRIAFYARFVTPRRAVELGLLGLEVLHERGVPFEVDFFGIDLEGLVVPYSYVNHGILNSQQLSDLYNSATVGVVFSATNHSLVNKEMMACGLPVVDLDLDSVRKIFPEDVIAVAEPTPEGIADCLEELLKNEELRATKRASGLEYVQDIDWSQSARMVEAAIQQRIEFVQSGNSRDE